MAGDVLHLGLEPRTLIAGRVICGMVTLRLSKPRLLPDIHVELIGEGSVYWTEYGYFYGNMSRYREYARSWSTAVTLAQPRFAAFRADASVRIPAAIAAPRTQIPSASTIESLCSSKVVKNGRNKSREENGTENEVAVVTPIVSKRLHIGASKVTPTPGPSKIENIIEKNGTIEVPKDETKMAGKRAPKVASLRVENGSSLSVPNGVSVEKSKLKSRPGVAVPVPAISPLPGAAESDDFVPLVSASVMEPVTTAEMETISDSAAGNEESSTSLSTKPVQKEKTPTKGNREKNKKEEAPKVHQNGAVKNESPQEGRQQKGASFSDTDSLQVKSRGSLPLHFSGTEIFLRQIITLFPPPAPAPSLKSTRVLEIEATSVPKRTLAAGRHCFPFRVPLPRDLPPSFEGRHGHVRYQVQARLLSSTMPPMEAIANFLVSQPTHVPPDAQQQAVSAHGVCRPWPALCQGVVAATLELPGDAVRAGQRVRCSVCVENRSRKDVISVVCALKKVTDFQAQLPYRESLRDEVTLARQALGRVPSHNTGRWTPELSVPDAPPGFQAGRVVQLHYLMQLDVTLAGSSSNLSVQLPVSLWRTEDNPS